MNTSPTVNNSEGLEKVLIACKLAMNAYEHIIGCDHPEAAKLRDHALNGVGKLNRERRRIERLIAKASVAKKTK